MTDHPKRIYKYVGPEHIGKVFTSSEAIALKCSFPKDFNDPYELFLTIDFNEKPDALAFYADVVGELPQDATTCFSMSPIVVPMWAHYAQNHQGFVIEFSEERLADAFPECRFDDVIYSDVPAHDLTELLYRAYVIAKPRYTYFLQSEVYNAAYFTKTTCWSYEQERRMIAPQENTRLAGQLILLDVPRNCITSIVCGSRASPQTKNDLAQIAESLGCSYFEQRIGRSSAIPYFVDMERDPFIFNGIEIVASSQHCETCNEPTSQTGECSWCQIDDELKRQVASRNPYRILDHLGLLDEYITKMDAVGPRGGKKG
ncbi:DUF2971 domain-containing protein [Bradyrhizobium sp. AS23.2]|uniref:DUF2971 domain-containing protein n=1 Tax=Bradyrhizobium sp. AS23.2 TaxID=1680155 RepID=UPI00093FDC36|nr:DUF2971 domain-containing protein [Bradyrhizobium sp. AS23.2]OKO85376.1 hypothetical protein AC630_06005 [Bradyrhizobium sp. AS23.2]